jgi:polysaccharide export outer membrane protein
MLLTTTGCSTIPSFGPSDEAINKAATEVSIAPSKLLPFQIVDVSAETLPATNPVTHFFPDTIRNQPFRTSDDIVEAGDQLQIRIWEISEDGLFATAGRRETIFEVTVSNSGTITVPYANSISASGSTTIELRGLLLDRYKGKAIEPEISVAISETQSRAATILGVVGQPGRVIIPSSGIKLLDLLAQTEGTSQPAWEILVTLQRASVTATVPLADILENSSNNIVVLPRDTINVTHVPRRFSVYGAIKKPGNIEIPIERATLAYLIAEAGGLNDRVAQARSAFVFRTHLSNESAKSTTATAYRIDCSRPDALMLAGLFRLEPTDITYIASADAADFERIVSIVLSPLLGTASRATSLGN